MQVLETRIYTQSHPVLQLQLEQLGLRDRITVGDWVVYQLDKEKMRDQRTAMPACMANGVCMAFVPSVSLLLSNCRTRAHIYLAQRAMPQTGGKSNLHVSDNNRAYPAAGLYRATNSTCMEPILRLGQLHCNGIQTISRVGAAR
jgi:hypothetical protein